MHHLGIIAWTLLGFASGVSALGISSLFTLRG